MRHRCHYEPSKRGAFEQCKECGDRFPCRDADCGHSDCMEARGKLSLCHYCRKRVTGNPSGFFVKDSSLAELREHDPEGTWTRWAVWGRTRTVHYACRDQRAQPEELRRWYGEGGKP